MGTRQGKRRKVEKKVTRGVQVVESQRATDVSKVKAKSVQPTSTPTKAYLHSDMTSSRGWKSACTVAIGS